MKEYNKEKLHEYAKELFALCLEKELFIDYNPSVESISISIKCGMSLENVGYCYMSEKLYFYSDRDTCMTIQELIEKVKQL